MEVGGGSKLPLEVQSLIKMIFDVESMKKTMAEFEVSSVDVLFYFTALLLEFEFQDMYFLLRVSLCECCHWMGS